LSVSHEPIDGDSVSKACDLLERLGELFSPENLDYQYAGGANRFFVRHAGVWHAITFSDTSLLVTTAAQLQDEVLHVVYGAGCPCSPMSLRKSMH